MAYQNKTWLNEEDSGATDENSVLNKTNMNDLESRILQGFNDAGINSNCKGISNQDLNTVCGNANGFFSGTNLTNAPNNATNIWFKVINISMNDVYKTQIAFNSSTGNAYYRSCVNGTWQNWVAFVNENSLASLLSTNGYQKIGKIVIQWGILTVSDMTEYSRNVDITFPIAFTNACLNLQATCHDPGQGSSKLNNGVGYGTATKTGATLRVKRGDGNSGASNISINWLAIGY